MNLRRGIEVEGLSELKGTHRSMHGQREIYRERAWEREREEDTEWLQYQRKPCFLFLSISLSSSLSLSLSFSCSLCLSLSGPDPLRFLRVALRIEISTRCVFCVAAGRIFIGFLSLPNLALKLNLNMSKRLRVEAEYRLTTLAYCGSNPRFETSGPANSSTKMAYWKLRFQPAAFLRSVFWATRLSAFSFRPLLYLSLSHSPSLSPSLYLSSLPLCSSTSYISLSDLILD